MYLLACANSKKCMGYSIGAVDINTVAKVVKEVTEEDRRRQALMDARPPLDEILNLHDFEVNKNCTLELSVLLLKLCIQLGCC